MTGSLPGGGAYGRSVKREITWLAETHPLLAIKARLMEKRAIQRGLRSTKGLGRTFSWTSFLAKKERERRAGESQTTNQQKEASYGL